MDQPMISVSQWGLRSAAALLLSCFLWFTALPANSQQVLTYHNNNARTASIHHISSVPISGSGNHNLIIVATEHGTLYAFDADTGARIWRVTTLKSGEGPLTIAVALRSRPRSGSRPRPSLIALPGQTA